METFGRIESVLKDASSRKANRIIIYNPPLIFQMVVDESSFTQTQTNLSHNLIIDLLSRFDFFLGFDLSRYSTTPALNYIGLLLKRFSHRIVLSAGLTYKTDLTIHSGNGYHWYDGAKLESIIWIAGEDRTRQALHGNKMHLLRWKIRKEEVKLVILWKCSHCNL